MFPFHIIAKAIYVPWVYSMHCVMHFALIVECSYSTHICTWITAVMHNIRNVCIYHLLTKCHSFQCVVQYTKHMHVIR